MKLTFCNGTVLHRQQVRSTFGDWLGGITELSKSLQAIDIDASAYACLSALTLVNGKKYKLLSNRWFLHICIFCRAPWTVGTEKSWKFANQDYKFLARPRDLQPRSPEETSLLQSHSGQAAGVEVTESASAPENILPETGGSGAGASNHKNSLLLQHSILNLPSTELSAVRE